MTVYITISNDNETKSISDYLAKNLLGMLQMISDKHRDTNFVMSINPHIIYRDRDENRATD